MGEENPFFAPSPPAPAKRGPKDRTRLRDPLGTMSLKLWGKTSRSGKVLVVAAFTKVDVELVPNFEMGKTNKTPAFLAMSPAGKVRRRKVLAASTHVMIKLRRRSLRTIGTGSYCVFLRIRMMPVIRCLQARGARGATVSPSWNTHCL